MEETTSEEAGGGNQKQVTRRQDLEPQSTGQHPSVILCIYLSKWNWRRRGQAEGFSKQEFYLNNSDASRRGPCIYILTCSQKKKDERTALLSVKSLINVSKKQEARSSGGRRSSRRRLHTNKTEL